MDDCAIAIVFLMQLGALFGGDGAIGGLLAAKHLCPEDGIGRGGLERREMLRDAGRFTVLAPTNSGIDTIPLHMRNTMSGSGNPGQADRGAVTNFVDLHIVEGVTSLGQLTSGPTNMRTLNGAIVQISGGADNAHMVQVSQAGVPIAGLSIARNGRIIGPVLTATNGIVLPLDTALLT
jgi:uncharacterized surface protein with fasciclin (FAS1) repeats